MSRVPRPGWVVRVGGELRPWRYTYVYSQSRHFIYVYSQSTHYMYAYNPSRLIMTRQAAYRKLRTQLLIDGLFA